MPHEDVAYRSAKVSDWQMYFVMLTVPCVLAMGDSQLLNLGLRRSGIWPVLIHGVCLAVYVIAAETVVAEWHITAGLRA